MCVAPVSALTHVATVALVVPRAQCMCPSAWARKCHTGRSSTPPGEPTPPPPPDSGDHAPSNRVLTVPNLLTTVRMVLSPVIGYLMLHGSFVEAAEILVFAGALDWADGYIARRFRQTSVLGSFLDPLADKTLLLCTSIPLAMQGIIHPAAVGLIVARDVGLVLGAFAFRAATRPPGAPFFSMSRPSDDFRVSPTFISKANTALQVVLVIGGACYAAAGSMHLLDGAGVHAAARLALDALTLVTSATTAWSGVDYARIAVRMYQHARR